MKVLIVAGGYLPGFRYGGPVRSLAALVERLGDKIDFNIVTSDRDLGSLHPYPGIKPDTWMQVGKAKVFYSSSRGYTPWFWQRKLSEVDPDVIYLLGFFGIGSNLVLANQRLRFLKRIPVIVAPQGEFSEAALYIKQRKKSIFLKLSKALGLHDNIFWQASAEEEQEDIFKTVGRDAKVFVAPDLVLSRGRSSRSLTKQTGDVRFVWISRIVPKKNLDGAIRLLRCVSSGSVAIDVFGPIEDSRYWDECQGELAALPATVMFNYRGELVHDQVPDTVARYHFLFFPTHGENFGHVIAEALDQGLPVLLSDQTPWRRLEQEGVGWDMALEDTEKWSNIIARCIDMDDIEYNQMSRASQGYVDRWTEEHGGLESYFKMFSLVAESTPA